MKVRWAVIDDICRDVVALSGDEVACWAEDATGAVKAGSRPEAPVGAKTAPLRSRFNEVGRIGAVGTDADRWLAFLARACGRELSSQETVRDMADATARQWRHTNALLRMAESTELGLRPGLAVEKVLGILERSTAFGPGVGVVMLPGESVYTVFSTLSYEQVVDPRALAALDEVRDDVRLIGLGDLDAALVSACTCVRGIDPPLALGRLATETERFGFLMVPVRDTDSVTSEDFKMLAAAAKILSVAIENGYTLSRERDATRLKVENELLEEQAREMEELIHVVAHDLRSPMTSMYGFMHVALDEIDDLRELLRDQELEKIGECPDHIAEPLKDGIRSVEKLNRMVQRLLDFSRSARITYTFEDLDVRKIVEEAVASLGYDMSQKAIDVRIEDLPHVVGDHVQVEAVFGNLIDNAVKYMGEGRERRITVGASRGNETVYFVQDTGMGMSADEISKAFLPFRRFSGDAAPGEGIGLAHVRKIIDRHGGRIWCQSHKGQGTTFYFTFGNNQASEQPLSQQA